MTHFAKNAIVPLKDKTDTVLRICKLIGSGHQGDVYLAYDMTDQCYVAAKHCYGDFVSDRKKFYEKLKILADHPSPSPRLCWPKKVGAMTENHTFLFTMPLVEGYRPFTDLITNEDSVTDRQKAKILKQAGEVMQILYANKYIFTDLSATNLLYRIFPDGSVDVRFIDCDNITQPGLSLGVEGSGKYRAPELLIPSPNRLDGLPDPPSLSSDAFAFYVLAFRVLMRRHPLDGKLSRTKRWDDHEGFLEFYGRRPRFIFDGDENAPSDNIVKKWLNLPTEMKAIFRLGFSQKSLKDKTARPPVQALVACLEEAYSL